MAESILVLTHADETGSALTKASLEAVTAGKQLAAQLGTSLSDWHCRGGCKCCGRRTGGSWARAFSAFRARRLRRRGMRAMRLRARRSAELPMRRLCLRRAVHGLRALWPAWRIALADSWTRTSHRSARLISVQASRWFYRQRIEAVITRAARPWFLLLDAGTHAAFAGANGEAQVEPVAVELPAMRTTVTGMRVPAQDAQTIRPDAKMLFVAGAGWTKKQPDGQVHASEAGELILGFLHKEWCVAGQFEIACRPGRRRAAGTSLPDPHEPGRTDGSTPRHAKGLSTCCHGEEPHVVGWRFIGERRAISLDPNCGWTRGKADVVYVADAFKVMAKVNELLPSL